MDLAEYDARSLTTTVYQCTLADSILGKQNRLGRTGLYTKGSNVQSFSQHMECHQLVYGKRQSHSHGKAPCAS